MAQFKRRDFLKAGIAGILVARQAPVFAQQSQVHWIKWNDFVPASDELLRKSMLPEAMKALGIKINLETVNGNDLQPRVTSAIQSGSGPDLFMLFNNHPHIYGSSAVDVSDVASAIAKAQGGYYNVAKANTTDGKKTLSVPWAVIGAEIAYRKSWFDEIGYSKFPETWEQYHDAGKKLKAKGRPLGQTLGHTFGDAPTFSYPYLWSWGGKEVDEKGNVVLNSKETIESVKFMQAFWKDSFDEGGLAWDDTNNNRAFLSGTIAATLNGASIYIETLRKPDQYKTEKNAPMKDDIRHSPLPKGPKGQFGFHLFQSHMVMGYSKNQKAAKEFLTWIHTPANYEKWFLSQKGYSTPPTAVWEKHKMWDADPVMAPFKIAAKLGLSPGYAGPPNRKSAEVLTKYVITDMYAKAVQGMSAEEAVKWAAEEVRKVYAGA
ncbi:MAG TPA: extracellular solute-binding protein [Burkholderiales bacterium]|jgi:multiple sugar transport system substrate-binding protein|nr:extracellular solute-binding protein [Burkholderiales bacterium]